MSSASMMLCQTQCINLHRLTTTMSCIPMEAPKMLQRRRACHSCCTDAALQFPSKLHSVNMICHIVPIDNIGANLLPRAAMLTFCKSSIKLAVPTALNPMRSLFFLLIAALSQYHINFLLLNGDSCMLIN